MAAPEDTTPKEAHVGKKKKPVARYWDIAEKDGTNSASQETLQQNTEVKRGVEKRKDASDGRDGAEAKTAKLEPKPGSVQGQGEKTKTLSRKEKRNLFVQRDRKRTKKLMQKEVTKWTPRHRGNDRKKMMAKEKTGKGEKKVLSGKSDPFPGSAQVPEEEIKKFRRKGKTKLPPGAKQKLKGMVTKSNKMAEMAQTQAARYDLLLPEDAGFLEGDEGEDTCTISQEDIADAVDITSGAKYFNLNLSQFGPYRLDYSKTGRHLLIGGRRGHVACMDWHSKELMCEINVMETINDVKWLHTEAMYAVAQKKWLYIYDSKGIELHCIRKFNDVLRMQFLPYHFLLATASATGFLQYLDVSIGKEVAAISTKAGRLDVMSQNPQNAIIHLGHSNGTVSLWSPNQKEALVKILCHQGGVRSVTVDKTGTYMVTSGMDKKLKVYDIRAFKPLQSYFLPAGASCLSLSQRGLLSAATGDVVQVYQDICRTPVKKPYMAHRVRGTVWGLNFCPFEDVLGVGHDEGFTSMVVPGAGEPNFDALDANPYRSLKQRREWEVKALLEKIQPELISLDPGQLGQVDQATWEQRHQSQVEALGYDPLAQEKFQPKLKKKGRSSSGNIEKRKKKVAHDEQRDLIKKTVAQNLKLQKERKEKEKKEEALSSHKSALDRFKK